MPGQYDQRADACEQCFQLLTEEKNVKVKCAKVIDLCGNLTKEDISKIQKYLINPVDQRLASLDKLSSLQDDEVKIDKVPIIKGFINFSKEQLVSFVKEKGLAMNYDDLKVTQDYFKDEEKRDPTETEIKAIQSENK